MIKSVHRKIGKVPTPMAGLALGIASIFWCWENFGSFHGNAQLIGAIIGGALLCMVAFKFILHPQLLLDDLAHPVVGSVAPTFAMGTMVVSATVDHYSPAIGSALWIGAVVLHLIFLAVFTVHRARDFSLHHMVPSWFVPPIGIIVAAVSVPNNPVLREVAQYLQNFGMLCYAVMLPMMLYRFIFTHNVPDGSKPTIAIMAAPASLSLAGYLTVMSNPSPVIVALLFGIAVLMTFLIYLAFFHLLRLPFSPGYAAFTFPMAIGATALFKLTNLMRHWNIDPYYVNQVHQLANLELIVASIIIGYVAVRYQWNYLPRGTAQNNDAGNNNIQKKESVVAHKAG